jgi:CBS domain containing-hemolysin-like protein
VPDTSNAFRVIEDLRGNRTGMAIVLNEYGAVAGLVTLEDLLEQLVGPIDDEHDTPAPADPIRPLEGSRFDVDASVPLEIVNKRLGLDLPTEEEFETIGGLVLHALGRLPEDGEKFRHNGIEFTVLDVHEQAIRRLLIDLQPSPAASANGS